MKLAILIGLLLKAVLCLPVAVGEMDDSPIQSQKTEMKERALELIRKAYQEAQEGQKQLAEEHYTQALDIYVKELYSATDYPNGHPYIASLLYDLGNTLHEQGKLAEASNRYRESLAMWRKLHPEKEGHPEIAMTLVNLGVTLAKQGNFVEACECQKEALQMRRRLYPKGRFTLGHPEIMKSLASLSFVLSRQGNDVGASICRTQAVDMARRLDTGKPGPVGHAGARKISFDGTDFYLTHSEEQETVPVFVDEYLPLGQSFDDYDKMITIQFFPALREMEAKTFASQLGRPFEKIDPECRPRQQEKNGGSEVFTDYVFSTEIPDSLLEFNLFRVMKTEKGGLLVYQYTARVLNPTPEEKRNFRQSVEKSTSKWTDKLGASTFPRPNGKPE